MYFPLLALLLILGPGCALPSIQGTDNADVSTARRLSVPFYAQTAYQCGPSALASVMSYRGQEKKPDAIASGIFSPAVRGTLNLDLFLYARRHGFEARQGPATDGEIRASIDSDVPVIVLTDDGFWVNRRGHYMVVTGYGRDGFFVHDGRTAHRLIPADKFRRMRERGGNWALFIGPGKIPGEKPGGKP